MLSMNETIRARRRALGMTQEQLADRLGVSAPAVSKWEQGASYPDVTLLPALGIDLNTLMGFARTPEKAEIARMLTRVSDAARAEGVDAGLTLAKAFLREYPSCGALLFGLAATLEGRMMMAGMTQAEREPVSMQLEDWYARAAESEDEEAREAAAHLLASRALGRGDADAAIPLVGGIARDRGAVPGVSCRVRRLRRDVRSAQLFLQMVPRSEDGQVNIPNGTGGCDEGASIRSIWNLCFL